jgi:uncharacterized membrane protein YfcA
LGETLLLSVGALVAAAVSGATGFGFALVATALWSQLLEPRVVTVLALVYMLALNIGYLPIFWREIPWRRLAPYAVGGVLGVPLGAWTLGVLPASIFRPTVGALLLVYAAWMLARVQPTTLVLSARTGPWLDAGIGLVGGFLGGMAGLSGFLPSLWCALRGGDKKSNRALVQAYILLTGVMGIAWIGGLVGIDAQIRERLWFGAPFVVVGGALGLYVFSRLDALRFNRLVLWLLGACGAILLLRG